MIRPAAGLAWRESCYYSLPAAAREGRTEGTDPEQESLSLQTLMLIGAVLLGLVTALGTSSLVLSLLLRIMSKLR